MASSPEAPGGASFQRHNLGDHDDFSSYGLKRLLSYTFNYNTPNLNNGITVYRAAANEILVDGWLEIITAFNGTTLHGDFGIGGSGIYQYSAGSRALSSADQNYGGMIVSNVIGTAAAAAALSADRSPPLRFVNSSFRYGPPLPGHLAAQQ